ncbi:MAG: hypothetical protein KKD05_05375 [Candidatus Omnitrophica bacterium]|nr:hypothetical protein [Candidatus Omnitrophota bacterium]
MSLDTLRQILGWCSIINLGILFWWFALIAFAGKWVYKIHGKWFKMPEEQFNAIHYSGIMFYKLTVFILFIVPYIVLTIIR